MVYNRRMNIKNLRAIAGAADAKRHPDIRHYLRVALEEKYWNKKSVKTTTDGKDIIYYLPSQ